MKSIPFIFILVFFSQWYTSSDTNSFKNKKKFALYYNLSSSQQSVNVGLSGKYDDSWITFLQNVKLDTNYMITDRNIKFIDLSYDRLSFVINKKDSVAFKDMITYKTKNSGNNLFIITLDGEKLFAGQFMHYGIAFIPEYPHLRYLNYPPDTEEQILELWGKGFNKTDVRKIIEHFKRSGKIKSK